MRFHKQEAKYSTGSCPLPGPGGAVQTRVWQLQERARSHGRVPVPALVPSTSPPSPLPTGDHWDPEVTALLDLYPWQSPAGSRARGRRCTASHPVREAGHPKHLRDSLQPPSCTCTDFSPTEALSQLASSGRAALPLAGFCGLPALAELSCKL